MKSRNQFLTSLIQDMFEQKDPGEIQDQLYTYLLQNTNNGKLYKYRKVSDHTIKDLESQTLFCAKPTTFNDPFDFKIGMSFSSLLNDISDLEINFIEHVINQFFLYQRGILKIDDLSGKEKDAVIKLSNDNKVMKLVKKVDYIDPSKEVADEFVRNNIEIVLEMMDILVADEQLKHALPLTKEYLPKITGNITSDDIVRLQEKSTPLSSLATLNGIETTGDEIDLMERLISVMTSGNKNEFEKTIQALKGIVQKVIDSTNNAFSVGCLSSDYKNRLMWSHYGDAHKGICIEYDFSEMKENALVFPVIYSEKRPVFSWKAAISKTPENITELNKSVMIGLLTKDKIWEYENEWRVLIPAREAFQLPLPISKIFLGEAIDNNDRKKVLKIAKHMDIPVAQMWINQGEYSLFASELC